MSKVLKAFLENQAGIKRHIARFCETPDDVSEIAQETFLRAFAAERRYDIANQKAFLYKVARNAALEVMRRKKIVSVPADSEALDLIVDERQLPAEEVMEGRRKLRLFAMAVAELPEQCQTAFTLRHVEGLKYKQIADRMKISVSAVEKHVAAGLVKCRAYLQDNGYEATELGVKPARRSPPDIDTTGERT